MSIVDRKLYVHASLRWIWGFHINNIHEKICRFSLARRSAISFEIQWQKKYSARTEVLNS